MDTSFSYFMGIFFSGSLLLGPQSQLLFTGEERKQTAVTKTNQKQTRLLNVVKTNGGISYVPSKVRKERSQDTCRIN
jgi:hypothetical protein